MLLLGACSSPRQCACLPYTIEALKNQCVQHGMMAIGTWGGLTTGEFILNMQFFGQRERKYEYILDSNRHILPHPCLLAVCSHQRTATEPYDSHLTEQ